MKVAKQYHVSVDFVLGCSPKPEGEQISADALHLLEGYETLSADERRLILDIITALRNARTIAGGESHEK